MGRRIASVTHQAVLHVVGNQLDPCLTQGRADSSDLGEDLDAVAVFLHHPSQSGCLAFDAGQPPDELRLLFLCHKSIIPLGVLGNLILGGLRLVPAIQDSPPHGIEALEGDIARNGVAAPCHPSTAFGLLKHGLCAAVDVFRIGPTKIVKVNATHK